MIFDLCGHARLAFDDPTEHAREAVRSLMDPYPGQAPDGQDVDVLLESRVRSATSLTDIHNPAGDGVTTASDGVGFYLVRRGRTCSLPAGWNGFARLTYEPGFPIWSVFASLVRPALHLALLERGCVAVHSTSVAIGGRGIVVAGWSESGKTETALALLERGGTFVSDKWTILTSDGQLAPFPISVGVRRWVLPFLPTLEAALPRRASAQLALAGAADWLSGPIRRRTPRGGASAFAVGALERALALGDRAALRPSELAAAYGQAAPTRDASAAVVALLTTTDGEVTVRRADPGWAARRLARSAAFERRSFFELLRRARYAFPESGDDIERAFESREEAFLRARLADLLVLDVRAPFPTDPRRVADAIARWT